jgi:hypothetical protein
MYVRLTKRTEIKSSPGYGDIGNTVVFAPMAVLADRVVAIWDAKTYRAVDLALFGPGSPLTSIHAAETLDEILQRLAPTVIG